MLGNEQKIKNKLDRVTTVLVSANEEQNSAANELKRQREKMGLIDELLDDMQGLYTQARTTVNTMTQRQIYTAFLYLIIGIALLVAIILVFYYKFIAKK